MELAIIGYGVVGSGVARLLERNNASITARSMQPSLRLKYILDLLDFPGDPFEQLVIHDIQAILDDPAVGIVVETIGGLHPAYEFVLACLRAGKSVVTSNKELVAVKGYELMQVSKERNVNFLFEASVGGGIPVIRPLSQCLAANEISEVAGILNGTTNFILTKMIEDAMSFEDALRLAQAYGYAESDPTADVEGLDACRKICILATLAFGRHVYPQQVRTEGISKITLTDVAYANQLDCAVKLLARAVKRDDGRVAATVAPTLVPRSSLLACVGDVYNAILIRGDAVDDVIFYGRGAGRYPTASAVVADIVDCAKHTVRRRFFNWEDGGPAYVAPAEEELTRFYARGCVTDPDAAVEAISRAFPNASFLSICETARAREIAFTTDRMKDGEARGILASLPGIHVDAVLPIAEF